MATSRHKHVVALDLLRVAACTLVLLYHFAFWDWTPSAPLSSALSAPGPAWGRALHFGWIGVEIFFVISGYVIAYSSSDTGAAGFFQSRFLRLAPANWICASLAFLYVLVFSTNDPGSPTLHYLETLIFYPLNAIDGVWWTLAIEIDFYLLVCILLKTNKRDRLESIMVAWGGFTLVFWLGAITLLSVLGDTHEGLSRWVVRAEGNRELQLLLVQHACFFALGVVWFNASREGMTRARWASIAMLLLACALEIVGQNSIIVRASHLPLSPYPALLAWSLAMLLFAAGLVWKDRIDAATRPLSRPIRFVGAATYPMYLIHSVAGLATIRVSYPILGLYALPLGALAAVACAGAIAIYPEPRLRRFILRHWPEPGRAKVRVSTRPEGTRQDA